MIHLSSAISRRFFGLVQTEGAVITHQMGTNTNIYSL